MGEAHAAVDLDAGLGVGLGRVARGDLGRVDEADHVVDAPARHGDPGGVDDPPGQLGPGEHVGAEVLHGLERPDRLVELLPLLA